jgi:hypothetical protein
VNHAGAAAAGSVAGPNLVDDRIDTLLAHAGIPPEIAQRFPPQHVDYTTLIECTSKDDLVALLPELGYRLRLWKAIEDTRNAML